MQAAISRALSDLEARVGDIDDFVAGKLGYSRDELLGSDKRQGYFSAEQVDALALAIDNVENDSGFIIGDQTGVGKGRFVAAMIRYGIQNGRPPIFVTQRPALYADMVRDLRDIGMPDIAGRILVSNNGLRGDQAIPLSADTTDTLQSLPGAKQGAAIKKIVATGSLPDDYEALFTTYSQMQYKAGTVGEETDRQLAMRALAPQGLIIMDESHEAGGSESKRIDPKTGEEVPTRADFFRAMLQETRGAIYSSATYAKNPTVMSLYFKTDLSVAVENMEELAGAIQAGGVPLQQVVANMLVEAGQYARRERSFDGVEMNLDVLPTNDKMGRAASDALRNVFALDQDFMEAVRESYIEEAAGEGDSGGRDGAIGESSAGSTNFASIMHVVVSQMLLSLKAKSTVDKAIALHRAGEKPIIALSNTNASIISDYVDEAGLKVGDRADLTFNAILNRYLRRLRRITLKDPNGDKRHVYLTDAQILEHGGPDALEEFHRVEAMVRDIDLSEMPASPIDYIVDRLAAEGIKAGEITGRQVTLRGGVYSLRDSSDAAKKREMNAFNAGGLDALVINRSGSTGFSLHAQALKGNDGKKRHMIILQPDPNIDTFMQMLGRIHRTGQIKLPGYTIGVSDLAIEKRLAAVLMRKMASLNANTTASKKSAVSLDNVTDFLNRYGDQVVAEYLRENTEVANLTGLEAGANLDGLAAKFTGRLAILPPEQVSAIYDEIEASYREMIETLDRMGMNALEAKTLELDARSVETAELVEAKDGIDSPFAEGAVIETMDVKKLGKPMTSAEVDAEVEKSLGAMRDTAAYNAKREQQLDEAMPRFLAKIQAGKERATQAGLAAKTDKQKDKAADALRRWTATEDMAQERLRTIKDAVYTYTPGKAFILSVKEGEAETTAYAVSLGTDLKAVKDNPTAASAVKVRFAIADAGREVIVPLSKLVSGTETGVTAIPVQMTATVRKAFDDGQTEAREKRQIITGNILAGFNAFKKGRITMFTDASGAVRQGILMPKGFNAEGEMAKRPVVFKDPAHVAKFLAEDAGKRMVKTSDDKLAITASSMGEFSLRVAVNGGKPYYLNQAVRALIGGEGFTRRGGQKTMSATVRSAKALTEIVRAFQENIGAIFQTTASKDEARAITGEKAYGETTKAAVARPAEDGFAFEATPEAIAAAGDIVRDLRKALGRIAPGVDLSVVQRMFSGGRELAGLFNETVAGHRLVAVALEAPGRTPQQTLGHEALHAVWPLLRPAEQRAVLAAARADEKRMARARAEYPHLDEIGQAEEVVADLFGEWRAGRGGAQGFVRSAFERIAAFLKALGSALRGNGFTTAESVYRRIESGEVGRRGKTDARGEPRFSKAPAPDSPAFKRWFGSSKVVNPDGSPMAVYHGSAVALSKDRKGIEAFDPAMLGAYTGANSAGYGFFFSSSPTVAESYNMRAMERAPLGGPQKRVDDAERALELWEEGVNTAEAVFDEDEDGWMVEVTEYDMFGSPFTYLGDDVYDEKGEASDAADELIASETEKAAKTLEKRQAELDESNRDLTLRTGPTVYPVYLSIENPLIHDFKGGSYEDQSFSELMEEAKEDEHDGVLLKNVRDAHPLGENPGEVSDVWVAFEPTQIKSVFNTGAFDPADPRIRFAVARPETIARTPEERPRVLDRALDIQPIDYALRAPFALVGGIDAQGRWKPGLALTKKGEHLLTAAKFADTGRFAFVNPLLEKARAGLIDRYGLDPAYVERERVRGLDERRIMAEVPELMAVLRDRNVGAEEARVLQAVLTGEAVADADMAKIAEPIRQAIDEMGQEAVMLGLISPESFERNRGSYLHRVYMKDEGDAGGLQRWASRWLTRRRRKIVGDQFKGRGLFEEIDVDRLMRHIPGYAEGTVGRPNKGDRFRMLDLVSRKASAELDGTEREGRTLKRVWIPADVTIPPAFADWTDRGVWEVRGEQGSKLTLWRDFTREEREKMGEIVDARYTIAKTYMMMAKDLATGRFFKDVAANEEWARTSPPPNGTWKEAGEYSRFWGDPDVAWVRVPETKISKSNTYRYGALAGKWVRAEIWRDLDEMEAMNRPTTWRALMTQWKLNKTARSPVVHMNNVMSNFMLLDMAGVTHGDLARAVREMRRGGPLYREAVEHGAFGTDMVAQELRENELRPLLAEIATDMKGGGAVEAEMQRTPWLRSVALIGRILDAIYGKAKTLDRKMTNLYQAEDEVFRMATYIRRRKQGLAANEAALDARDQFMNYDIRAPWVNAARRTVLPFIAYTYRAVPIVAKTVATRPWKLAKYFAVTYALNALAYQMAPSDDDEETERKSLREAEQGHTWVGTPRMLRMPWTDEFGRPVFLDIRRWIPAGDVFDVNAGTAAIDLPSWLMLGGPLMMGAELFLNRSAFTGDDIVNELTDTGGEKASKVGDYLWKSWMPSAAWIPGSWYWEKILNAATGATDAKGRDYSAPQAVASSVGIKVKPQDVEEAQYWQAFDFEQVERELKKQKSKLGRDLDRGLISEAEYNRQMEKNDWKMDRLNVRREQTLP